MLENEFHISKLIASYLRGTLTGQEQKELDVWLSVSPDHQQLLEELSLEAHLNQELTYFSGSNKNSVWDKVQNGLADRDIQVSSPIRKLWPRIAAAAAILIAVSSGLIFYLYNGKQNTINTAAYTSDISPGKQGATLTLANGKKIKLSDVNTGELAKEAGVTITKSADGQIIYEIKNSGLEGNRTNTLSTIEGETYTLTLPDKSKVWLNAASSLTYSASLMERGVRRVKLEGEAYFEISKDKAHPFIVQTAKQEVEVLGTHFNVNSYADEPATATTLLEGSVKVTAGELNQILKPGQQALNTGSAIKVAEVNTENITAWKNGGFALSGDNFKTAMNKIARWYGVEVIYDSSLPDELEAGGWISRNNTLSAVLRLIESSGQVHFKIEGRKVYVSK